MCANDMIILQSMLTWCIYYILFLYGVLLHYQILIIISIISINLMSMVMIVEWSRVLRIYLVCFKRAHQSLLLLVRRVQNTMLTHVVSNLFAATVARVRLRKHKHHHHSRSLPPLRLA